MYSSIHSFLNSSPLKHVVSAVLGTLWNAGDDAKTGGRKDTSQNSVLRLRTHPVRDEGRSICMGQKRMLFCDGNGLF